MSAKTINSKCSVGNFVSASSGRCGFAGSAGVCLLSSANLKFISGQINEIQ